jgi:hypothetical protein
MTKYFSMVAGNMKFAQGLQTYLLSRDHSVLKSEFQLGNGKVCLCFLLPMLMCMSDYQKKFD